MLLRITNLSWLNPKFLLVKLPLLFFYNNSQLIWRRLTKFHLSSEKHVIYGKYSFLAHTHRIPKSPICRTIMNNPSMVKSQNFYAGCGMPANFYFLLVNVLVGQNGIISCLKSSKNPRDFCRPQLAIFTASVAGQFLIGDIEETPKIIPIVYALKRSNIPHYFIFKLVNLLLYYNSAKVPDVQTKTDKIRGR